jgi:hypothetical protein
MSKEKSFQSGIMIEDLRGAYLNHRTIKMRGMVVLADRFNKEIQVDRIWTRSSEASNTLYILLHLMSKHAVQKFITSFAASVSYLSHLKAVLPKWGKIVICTSKSGIEMSSFSYKKDDSVNLLKIEDMGLQQSIRSCLYFHAEKGASMTTHTKMLKYSVAGATHANDLLIVMEAEDLLFPPSLIEFVNTYTVHGYSFFTSRRKNDATTSGYSMMPALSVSVGDYEACLTRLRHVKKIPSLNELYFALSVCQLQPISKFVPGLIAKSSAPVLYNRNMYWQQKNQELISHCTGNETFQ